MLSVQHTYRSGQTQSNTFIAHLVLLLFLPFVFVATVTTDAAALSQHQSARYNGTIKRYDKSSSRAGQSFEEG